MAIFRSQHQHLNIPTNLTTWEWLFDSASSPVSQFPETDLAGYQNAVTKERINWKQVKEASIYLSTALVKKYGLKAGGTVSLFSQNSIWYPVAMFGTLRAGGVVSGASPAYNVEEMSYALKTAHAEYLMTSSECIEVAIAAAKEAKIPESHVFLLEGHVAGFASIKELIELGRSYRTEGQAQAFKLPPGKINRDICGYLSFSSGTTGLPKAVMISHHNVIAQSMQVQLITPEDHRKILAVLPLFHITGLVHIIHMAPFINAEVIMLPTFTMESMLQNIVEYQIKEILLVPPIIIRLVRDPVVDKYDLSCIQRFSSGAAPLSEEILQLLQKKFPGTGFKQGYGMTESCSCITAHPQDKYDYKYAHSGGAIVANTEVRIVDESGRECGVGEPGEILARGPQVVMGYLANEKATRETFDSDGWLHTGDQGVITEEGMVYITDRIKEMIKVKGIGVAPAEIEDLLLGHEDVEDVAVLGIDDDYSGEKPKAYIVLKSGRDANQVTGRKLLQFVKEKKVRHKWVKEIEFTKEIPKSASGKILRKVLRALEKDKTSPTGVITRDDGREKAML